MPIGKINKICFWARGRGILLMKPRTYFSSCKKLNIKAFFWGIVCFCTTNGSFRILKKTGEIMFLIFVILRNYGNNLFSKIFLQSFQNLFVVFLNEKECSFYAYLFYCTEIRWMLISYSVASRGKSQLTKLKYKSTRIWNI